MPTVLEVYSKAVNEGKAQEVSSRDILALIANLMHYGQPLNTLMHKDEQMDKEEEFWSDFARLLKREPVEYITHEADFLEFRLTVDNRVLIPRMETQELVANITERIGDYFDPRLYLLVADIGTGSGAIALAIAKYYPNWLVTATDTSNDALEVAKENFDNYFVNVKTLKGRSLEPFIEAGTRLDVIVCNPPYVLNKEDAQPSVVDYEPASALFFDKNNSVYEDILKDLDKVRKESILVCFEIDPNLADYLQGLISNYCPNAHYEFINDLNGFTRFLFIFIGEER